jgi:hypothetical protein
MIYKTNIDNYLATYTSYQRDKTEKLKLYNISECTTSVLTTMGEISFSEQNYYYYYYYYYYWKI